MASTKNIGDPFQSDKRSFSSHPRHHPPTRGAATRKASINRLVNSFAKQPEDTPAHWQPQHLPYAHLFGLLHRHERHQSIQPRQPIVIAMACKDWISLRMTLSISIEPANLLVQEIVFIDLIRKGFLPFVVSMSPSVDERRAVPILTHNCAYQILELVMQYLERIFCVERLIVKNLSQHQQWFPSLLLRPILIFFPRTSSGDRTPNFLTAVSLSRNSEQYRMLEVKSGDDREAQRSGHIDRRLAFNWKLSNGSFSVRRIVLPVHLPNP